MGHLLLNLLVGDWFGHGEVHADWLKALLRFIWMCLACCLMVDMQRAVGIWMWFWVLNLANFFLLPTFSDYSFAYPLLLTDATSVKLL